MQGGLKVCFDTDAERARNTATASIPCGPDLQAHIEAIRAYEPAGFDELYIQQIGPRQDEFFAAYAEHVLPRFR